MPKFRKKPVVIDAVQWNGKNSLEIALFSNHGVVVGKESNTLVIGTLEGDMTASLNDWIIKGVSGEFYPCKPDIFEKTYEKAD